MFIRDPFLTWVVGFFSSATQVRLLLNVSLLFDRVRFVIRADTQALRRILRFQLLYLGLTSLNYSLILLAASVVRAAV